MHTKKLLIIIVTKLAAVITGQVWPPYETYNPFHNSNPYQGLEYGGGCKSIIMAQIPCRQRLGQWNLYPDYQWQNYNTRPYTGIMPQTFVPYGSGITIPRSTGINLMDLLNSGVFLNSPEVIPLGNAALTPRLQGANILNDKNRFTANGCSYDTNSSKCVDNFNLCKGKCKNFGDGLTNDCRCVPDDLLTILGLPQIWK